MAPPQMDAVTSFTHLIDNIPLWLEQVQELSVYTKDKNVEFVAEYSRLVKAVKPKRLKSPSIASIHSSGSKSAQLPDIDPVKESAASSPDPNQVDPLQAGNRFLYNDQNAQRKRKSNASLRSGASGPQKFRSKHQVVIYFDGHVQQQLDTMVKAIGVARNNLRKGRNAHSSSLGFRLPALIAKRYDGLTSPSIENIRTMSKYRASGLSSSGSKSSIRLDGQQSQDPDEAAFLDSDKVLEQVQNLYETAAHQFLRDGDCLKELNSAEAKLRSLVDTAKTAADSLKEKAKQQAAEEAADAALTVDDSRRESTSEHDCPSLLTDKSSIEPLRLPTVAGKTAELTALAQTLEDMAAKGITTSQPPANSNLPQAGMTIEVDDGSDGGSLEEFDMSKFRSTNRLRMRG